MFCLDGWLSARASKSSRVEESIESVESSEGSADHGIRLT